MVVVQIRGEYHSKFSGPFESSLVAADWAERLAMTWSTFPVSCERAERNGNITRITVKHSVPLGTSHHKVTIGEVMIHPLAAPDQPITVSLRDGH